MSSTSSKSTFIRRVAFAAGPLLVLMLVWPVSFAHATIFTELFSTITKLATSCTSIQGGTTAHLNFMSNNVYPASLVNQSHLSITSVTASFRPWMARVLALPTNSATMASTSQLESFTRGGTSMNTNQISPSFKVVYGTTIPTKGAAPFVQTASDMSDAQAVDVFSLTSSTDQGANMLIAQAHQIEDAAATVSPGNAAHEALQAKALELYSAAVRHRLLAANLRMEAVDLANATGAIKQQMVNFHPGSTYRVTGSN